MNWELKEKHPLDGRLQRGVQKSGQKCVEFIPGYVVMDDGPVQDKSSRIWALASSISIVIFTYVGS